MIVRDVSPKPFYQIYEGAQFLAGAKPHYLPCLAAPLAECVEAAERIRDFVQARQAR